MYRHITCNNLDENSSIFTLMQLEGRNTCMQNTEIFSGSCAPEGLYLSSGKHGGQGVKFVTVIGITQTPVVSGRTNYK